MATRWGIVSAGKISHDFVTALSTLPAEEHIVVAVAARKLESAQAFANQHNIANAYDSYEQIAKDPNVDVVYIGAIHPQHLPIGKIMLEGGKPILCEKPLTLNLKQTTELVDLARKNNLFLMEAIWSRFFPSYQYLKKQLDAGVIGEVNQVMVNFGVPIKEVDRIKYKDLGGGAILDLGVYTIQFAMLAFGLTKPEVLASGYLNEQGVDTMAAAIFKYKDGKTALLSCNANVALPNEAVVVGTKGIAKVEKPFWCPLSVTINDKPWDFELPKTKKHFNYDNSAGLRYEAMEVRRCLQEGLIESPYLPHEESLLIAELEDEMRRQIGVVYPQDL